MVCHFCLEKGPKQSECEVHIHSKDRDLYARYADEIREGRKADKEEGKGHLLDDVGGSTSVIQTLKTISTKQPTNTRHQRQ